MIITVGGETLDRFRYRDSRLKGTQSNFASDS